MRNAVGNHLSATTGITTAALISAKAAVRFLVPVGLVAVLVLAACTPAAPPAERAVNFGFEDVAVPGKDWGALNQKLQEVRANSVGIAVGRPDWTGFVWAGHSEQQSSQVRSSRGEDFVWKALEGVGTAPDGSKRKTTLVVDALVPGMIAEDSSLAGQDVQGKRSADFASVAALEHGAVGEHLVALVGDVAARYKPDAVSLTELMFDDSTFGDADADSYRNFSGQDDWPRNSDGSINTNDPSIGKWRSAVLAKLVARARDAAGKSGVKLLMDVRSPNSGAGAATNADLGGDRKDSGQDYNQLLKSSDGLVVWDYFGLNGGDPGDSKDLAAKLVQRDPGRISQSIGLWADENSGDKSGTVSATDLKTALKAAAEGGARSVSVTPASKLSDQHWQAIKEAWTR
ncbi:hypothetical protein ACQR35_01350 [Pseudarthrobacter sp. J1738]|uniref:hypothetical protein n=1 Tax=Pseudarthrobacter sp. J1738 TaxID=3420446 RepID=UPI003D27D021